MNFEPAILGFDALPENWQLLSLVEVCKGIFDCPHSTPNLSDSGPFMARTQDIRNGYFNMDEAVNVSIQTYENRTKRAEPRHGDLLFSREGTYFGDSAEVPANTKVCLGQRMVLLRPDNGIINSSFLRLWINSGIFQRYLMGFRDGTVAERLNMTTIKKLPVIIPPLTQQDFIVKQILPFEIKEANCRAVNQTLEEIVQAIFKSWFVDFEPVKAKIEAKANGQDPEGAAMCAISGKTDAEFDHLSPGQLTQLHATAAIFPDELTDSELGPIPKGWGWSTIGEEVDVVGGGTPSTKKPEFWEGGNFHWTTPKDLSGNPDKILFNTERKITKQGLDKISSGLLPVDTVLLSSRAPVGYLALAKKPVAINQGYIAMKCSKRLSPEYVLQWANSIMDNIKQRASGTTFAEISKKNFRIIPVLVPDSIVMKRFQQFAYIIYEKISKSIDESQSLAEIRDSLLPKLLSGEIGLPGVRNE